MTKKVWFGLIVPVVVSFVLAAANFFSFYRTADNRVYDLMLHLRPSVAEHDEILLLDVDDLSIEKVGLFPWPRSIMAEGLITLKEFGAKYAVFDIEYTESNPPEVDTEFIDEEFPQYLSYEYGVLKDYIADLFAALQNGQISLADSSDYINDYLSYADISQQELLAQIDGVARDNDAFMASAARFFGSAYYTITTNPQEQDKSDPQYEQWLKDNMAIEVKADDGAYPIVAGSIRPTIRAILEAAGGAGSPTVVIDDDGVRRRIELLHRYDAAFFPQLAFSALLDWLGNPDITATGKTILLEGAQIPGGEAIDIEIPLATDGRMLINWPKKEFDDSFTHLSYWYVVLHNQQEKAILKNLNEMYSAQLMSYSAEGDQFFNAYQYAEEIKRELMDAAGGDTRDYIEARKVFFAQVHEFLNGSAEEAIFAENFGPILSSTEYSDEAKADAKEIADSIAQSFEQTRALFADFEKTRSILAQNVKGSYSIIGWTGTSTTDVGVNPFDESYINVGTHAAVMNTIIQNTFLDDIHWAYAALGGLLISLIMFVTLRRMEAGATLIVGFAFLLGGALAGYAVFYFTGIYLSLLTPVLIITATFAVLSMMKLIQTAREKGEIRETFGSYLSSDVVKELIDDPEKRNLEGETRDMTAIFTDVKGFSAISEPLDDEPEKLTKLMNLYLTPMSDKIAEFEGYVDKYEGDAILAFWNAPNEQLDHPVRACQTALHIKKLEKAVSDAIIREGLTDKPLQTRIGINTGKMTVGNMGSEKKKNYTVMGSAVNLASRLEGVNKRYGTWIMISEQTYHSAGAGFATRELDRVRVINIDTPVRLYELLCENDDLTPRVTELLDTFHEGLRHFEQKDWASAERSFAKALEIAPDDGPSAEFQKRAKGFQQKPPPANWDGVYTMSEK